MNLLIFSYLLALFLFSFSYYLDARSEKTTSLFTSISMTTAFVSLFSGLGANLLYTGNVTIGVLAVRVALLCFAILSLSLMKFCAAIPYQTRNIFLNFLYWVFIIAALYLVFIHGISVTIGSDKKFTLWSGLVMGTLSGVRLYAVIFVYGIPGLTVFSLVARALGIRSRIYQQRLLLVALSILASFAVSWFLFQLSYVYGWAFPLIPFGLAVLMVLLYRSVSVTTLFDRSLVIATLTNFLLLSVIFSFLSGLTSALVIRVVPFVSAILVLLTALTVVILLLRDKASSILRRYIRIGSDYEADLEKGLDSIDFSSRDENVVERTVSLLSTYVECSSVDILVSNDKGSLTSVYSTTGIKTEVPIDSKGIDFLLNHNESIILKTQAISHHSYADVKNDLLKIFEPTRSDAFILLREGHRVIGLILLGQKKRGAEYTDYDYTVLSKLYSNFFLVLYYLKNIANESVVLTVDREIEFSGQIISSIQDNIDRIDHPKVDVDFITRSARKLGGDFIDFIKLGEDKYLYVMGDVSGKGLNASMSMVILKSVLRTFLAETSDFKQLVVKVNLFIKNNLPKGTFFAGVFGIIDFSTNTMFYINCGVPAMFLYTAAYNNAIEIQGDGKVLGFVKDIAKYIKVKKIVMNPQDIILLTTDGLVDSTNLRGERFGKDRVQRMLMDNRSYPAGRMAQFLCDSLGEFVSRELEDDITVLVFKYLSK